MKKMFTLSLVMILCCFPMLLFASGEKEGGAKEEPVTLRMLMEDVPDTHYIEPYLPDFEADSGINVEWEIVDYQDMHSKLLPQFLTPESSYDVIVVDNYWAGEFSAAGWLEPLDPYVKRDNYDISNYIDSLLDMVGYYPVTGPNKTLYMFPFYNYTMALIYRTDLMEDPKLRAQYKKQYGKELTVPSSLDEYVRMCKFMKDNTELYGASMQAARGDSIVMEWSNYLFAMGGDYYDRNWNVTINNGRALKAIEHYMKNAKDSAPEGVFNFLMDDAFRVMAQGRAWSMVTFNFQLAALNKPEQSKVVGKVAIAPMPGEKSLAGAWGWAIAHNTPKKEECWEFIKWVESFEIAKKRALNGGAPTRFDVLRDSDVLKKYPHYTIVEELLTRSKSVPEFTYSTQMVEIVGRELSLVGAEGKDPKAAMDQAAKELEELAVKAKLK